MPKDSLAERIARLEAIEEIKQLKALYCLHCDDNYDPDAIAALFTQDGTWDGGRLRGNHVGRAAIRKFFKGVSQKIVYAGHLVMNPIIEVKGNTATGRWRMLMPSMVREDGSKIARWTLGDYHEEYVKTGDRWRFKSLKVELAILDPKIGVWTPVTG
ncbi:MAG: nuclear transport factor 2 family protein [Pseudomonadota bacterium]